MNMLKKGPEIKLPELKVPEPILNVFYDLRERHLLPLVAVLGGSDCRGADCAEPVLWVR